jgi:excisionase family DNA binding protein
MPEPTFLTIREAAARAGRSTSWIREWIACGQLEARRLSGLMHVERDRLDELIAKSRRRAVRSSHLRLVVDNT